MQLTGTVASLIAMTAAALSAQPSAKPPAFEVAAIKPSAVRTQERMVARQGRVDFTGVSLKDLITYAYRMEDYQVTTPAWMEGSRFDIAATIPAGAPREQIYAMLRTLLEDRFKLKTHRSTSEHAVYAMVVAKGGPRLTKSAGPAAAPGSASMKLINSDTIQVTMQHATMPALARFITGRMHRPVIDETGIAGEYDIAFDASILDNAPAVTQGGEGAAPVVPPPPPLDVAAGIRRLGLRLEARKQLVEQLMADSAEKTPAEN